MKGEDLAHSPTVFKSTFDFRVTRNNKRTGHFGRDLFFEVIEHSEVKETYDEIMARLRIIKEKYYDATFPPEWSSLIGFGVGVEAIDMDLWKKIEWRRAPEIF